MKSLTRLVSATALAFFLAVLALPLFTTLTLAQPVPVPCSNCKGAPVPLIGAGLPGLAVGIGYGVYWLARRRRNQG